jgi:hypothetical protein
MSFCTIIFPVNSASPFVSNVSILELPFTNCKLPALFVVKSLGLSYIAHPFPASHLIPSPGPGSTIFTLLTVISVLFVFIPPFTEREPSIVKDPVIVSPVTFTNLSSYSALT